MICLQRREGLQHLGRAEIGGVQTNTERSASDKPLVQRQHRIVQRVLQRQIVIIALQRLFHLHRLNSLMMMAAAYRTIGEQVKANIIKPTIPMGYCTSVI